MYKTLYIIVIVYQYIIFFPSVKWHKNNSEVSLRRSICFLANLWDLGIDIVVAQT